MALAWRLEWLSNHDYIHTCERRPRLTLTLGQLQCRYEGGTKCGSKTSIFFGKGLVMVPFALLPWTAVSSLRKLTCSTTWALQWSCACDWVCVCLWVCHDWTCFSTCAWAGQSFRGHFRTSKSWETHRCMPVLLKVLLLYTWNRFLKNSNDRIWLKRGHDRVRGGLFEQVLSGLWCNFTSSPAHSSLIEYHLVASPFNVSTNSIWCSYRACCSVTM